MVAISGCLLSHYYLIEVLWSTTCLCLGVKQCLASPLHLEESSSTKYQLSTWVLH